jgi:hypothetical protein
MTTLHKPVHWEMIKHQRTSDYGENAYTLWPYGAIVKGLPPEAAAIINASADMLEALEAQQMAEYDAEASRRKGYFERAREMREAALAKAKRTDDGNTLPEAALAIDRPTYEELLDALEGLEFSLSPRKVVRILEAAGNSVDLYKAAHRHARAVITKARQ